MIEYLPLGSVVKLKEGKKSLMIVGWNQDQNKTDKNKKKHYDYIAVLYPEGYLNPDLFFLFNQEDIIEVTFVGCINAESQVFRQMLIDAEKENNPSGLEKEDKDGGK